MNPSTDLVTYLLFLVPVQFIVTWSSRLPGRSHVNQVSNTFYFTFSVRPEAKAMKDGFRIRNVVPATEEEARRILERMDAENLPDF